MRWIDDGQCVDDGNDDSASDVQKLTICLLCPVLLVKLADEADISALWY